MAAVGLVTAVSASHAAGDDDATAGKSIAGSMMRLSPDERVEQRCNAQAMGVVSREHKEFHADELVAYAFADTVINRGKVTAPGAAVRSRGAWYRMSYVCQTGNDGLAIQSFKYTLGAAVPRAQWAEHNLAEP